jgi:hypothetical protein
VLFAGLLLTGIWGLVALIGFLWRHSVTSCDMSRIVAASTARNSGCLSVPSVVHPTFTIRTPFKTPEYSFSGMVKNA